MKGKGLHPSRLSSGPRCHPFASRRWLLILYPTPFHPIPRKQYLQLNFERSLHTAPSKISWLGTQTPRHAHAKLISRHIGFHVKKYRGAGLSPSVVTRLAATSSSTSTSTREPSRAAPQCPPQRSVFPPHLQCTRSWGRFPQSRRGLADCLH